MKKISGKEGPEKRKTLYFILIFACMVLFGTIFLGRDVYAACFTCSDYFNRLVVTNSAMDLVSSDDGSDDYSLTIMRDGQVQGVITEDDITKKSTSLPVGRIRRDSFYSEAFPDLSSEKDFGLVKNLKFDEDMIDRAIRRLEFVSVLPDHPQIVVRISMNEDGLYELDDNHDTIYDKDRLIECIKNAIEEGEDTLDLSDFDFFLDLPYSEDQQKILDFYEEVKKWQEAKIKLEDMGTSLILEGSELAGLMVSSDGSSPLMGTDGKPVLSEAKLDDICLEIKDDFTSYDSTFWWKKHNGGTVSFNHVEYGVEVDSQKTYDLLKEAIVSGKGYSGTPVYTEDSKHNRLGDTYVEVDMTAQKMYFFMNGKLRLESDVVTGNKARHNDTPQTIEPIYFMQRNRVLVGENYRTPVKFWMAFHNHVGLHDATWRGRFGGEIYKTDGSHGCVNLPLKTAEELYGYVRVGTPVITYY